MNATRPPFLARLLPYAVGFLVLWALLQMTGMGGTLMVSAASVPYSELLAMAKASELDSVRIEGGRIFIRTKDGRHLVANRVDDVWFVSDMLKYGVKVEGADPPAEPSKLTAYVLSFGPVLLLVAVWVYFLRQVQRGQGAPPGLPGFSRSKARKQPSGEQTVLFSDVAGCDEAKAEVTELVEFLKDPARFHQLGGRMPRGVLLTGPPGTGKTLLARAIAGEAGVPFYSISGSDFVEMFVGVGAARVRDLFEQARSSAPCIVFIDEIDAVGRHRGAGLGGGNDEREQTLNQLLVEMDGFESSSGAIVIAATNRPDVLDPALLRPGRFDRQVVVGLPDVRGREQILSVHVRKIPASASLRLDVIARGTPGFSGADLANLVNEAALSAARRRSRVVEMSDFELAKDRIMMGPERRSLRMDDRERSSTAYHEAGHAVVARLLQHTDPVHKVSIVPRGAALGVTVQLPENDRYSMGKKRILDSIAVLFGGRVAEELFTDDVTTGASNDYERATQLARNMVTRWGMGESVGPMVVGESVGELFLGRAVQRHDNVSPETLRQVDEEVRHILVQQYARVRALLEAHRNKVEAMHRALLEWETLDASQIDDIMAGRPVRAPGTSVPASASSVPPPPNGAAVRPGWT